MKHTRKPAAVAALAVLALLGTGCSSKAQDTAEGTGKDGVRTGPGVTKDTVTLASLTDLTGPYASLGKSIVQVQQMWADEFNEAGGVCGRKVKIEVKDHGYDVQKAVSAYSEVSPDALAMPQVIGSPMVAALLNDIEKDKILTFPQAWSAALLGKDAVQVLGTTYDLDMITAVDFLMRERGLAKGDTLGHVYFEGDYGSNALEGARYAAQKHGLKLVAKKIKATDTDLSAQVTALRGAKANAMLISAGPTQTASLVGVAASQGFEVPVVSSAPGYVPQLLQTPAGPALKSMLHIVTAIPPLGSELPAVQKMVDTYQKKYPKEVIDSGVLSGFQAAVVMGQDLKAACEAKDLTRAGLVKAHRSGDAGDAELGSPQDFTDAARPAALAAYIVQPDAKAIGGTKLTEDSHEAPGAAEYLRSRGE